MFYIEYKHTPIIDTQDWIKNKTHQMLIKQLKNPELEWYNIPHLDFSTTCNKYFNNLYNAKNTFLLKAHTSKLCTNKHLFSMNSDSRITMLPTV